MKRLLIIGAGGCGCEVMQWAKNINEVDPTWKEICFLDSDLDALVGMNSETRVLCSEDDYDIQKDDEFICSIGNAEIRKRVIDKMKARGATIATIIHPTAVIADNCIIEEGSIIYPFALISSNAHVGAGCLINMYSSVAHDSILGEYCTISAHCDITGKCQLGNRVFMGTTSNMVPGTKIGDDAYICAGSTVMGRVRAGMKLMGNPAKIVKF